MALITSQQLANYYERFLNIDVTFNKQVAKAIGLRPQETFLRCLGNQWPSVIFSSSMTGAKIIANIKSDLHIRIREANNLVSLRFSFDQQDKSDSLAFFVSAKVTGLSPYSNDRDDLNFLTLTYTQRPSDDLIAILGTLLEANINSKKRKEERIEINVDSIRKLGFRSKDGSLFIEEKPIKCLIRDVSFSGARLIVPGAEKGLLEKDAKLRIESEDDREVFLLRGKVIRFEEVQDRTDIGIIAMLFSEDGVPMEYKMRLNNYLVSVR